MSFFNFGKSGRALLLTVVVAVGLLSVGCGGDDGGNDNPANNGNNNNNNGGGGSSETVLLGGLKWMKKNLNVKTADSWCYENSPDSCLKYGRLYTWEAAKSACQSIGMRLPSREEWDALETAVGVDDAGKKLKSKSGWNNNGNGTDDYEFSALPGGYRYPNGNFDDVGLGGYWWTATAGDDDGVNCRELDYNYDRIGRYHSGKDYGASVRCVKDE